MTDIPFNPEPATLAELEVFGDGLENSRVEARVDIDDSGIPIVPSLFASKDRKKYLDRLAGACHFALGRYENAMEEQGHQKRSFTDAESRAFAESVAAIMSSGS